MSERDGDPGRNARRAPIPPAFERACGVVANVIKRAGCERA